MKKVFRGKLLIMVALLVLISSTSVFANQQEYKVTKVDDDIGSYYRSNGSGFYNGLKVVSEVIRGDDDEELGERIVYLTKDGEIINLGDYDEMYDFSDGLAAVIKYDEDSMGKLGYIDMTGKIVFPVEHDFWSFQGGEYVDGFVDGYAFLYENKGGVYNDSGMFELAGDWHKIDKSGKIVDTVSEKMGPVYHGYRGTYVSPETINILGETIEYVTFNENLAFIEIYQGPNEGHYIVEKIESQDKPSTSEIKAIPSTSNVMVNGSKVDFDAYLIGENNYFKLRDLANSVNGTEKQFEVSWDDGNKAINLISNQSYTIVGGEMVKGNGTVGNVVLNNSKIYMDGAEVDLTAYTIDGNNYFKLRDVAKLFDIGITYDVATQTVGIDTSIGHVEE